MTLPRQSKRRSRFEMSARLNLVLIAAMGQNRELGFENQLLWKIPGDLLRFKQMTMGHPIIMGRKTFESIGRPLPGRQNIVISRDAGWLHDGVIAVNDRQQAMDAASDAEKVFIIGGGEIYRLFLDIAGALELTEVHLAAEQADTWFPEYQHLFVETHREDHLDADPPFSYVSYVRG